jgi:hypothetical protein
MGHKNKTDKSHVTDKPSADVVAIVDAVMDHVAQEYADSAEVFTPEEDRWAQALRRRVDSELARLRRQLTPVRSTRKRLPPISDELRALDRDGLLARLAVLRQASGVRYAHQDLTGLTTDDLRQLVAVILEPPTEE